MKQSFKVDNCKYCSCITHFETDTIAQAISLIEDGEIGCENCGIGEHKNFIVYWRNYCNGNWEIIYESPFIRNEKEEKGLGILETII